MRIASLFAGIGGFDLGIKQAIPSSEIVFASEIDKAARTIYQNHFGSETLYGDIKNIEAEQIPDIDMLVGGFPCQPFSLAGKRGGFKDTRGTLFYEIARVCEAKRPKTLFLENVKGLLSHDNGRTFGKILVVLDELGYDVEWQVLNSKYFGVPQNRERVFIVGHLRGSGGRQVFPIRQNEKTCNQKTRQVHDIARTLTKRGYAAWNGSYVFVPDVARCLTGGGHSGGLHSDMTIIPEKENIRRLTPIECERLQGFPDNWTAGVSDTARYRCLGNAVTVSVIRSIAERLT
jgi:DNA (cytosine-5)-methyltransferase 1